MLEFYPMDGETDIGFVEVPVEFESWLIAVSGISFEDVSLAVLGEEDGDIELIMDYDDYMNLCDLYYEYDTLGWMILEDPDYVDEINAIPEYDAEGYGEKMTFGTMEWSWETDEEDVDESYINEMIENEIRSTSDSSGNGQLDVDDDEGGSYEVYYDYHHVFSGYNTAETGYYAAEDVKVPVPTSEGGEMVELSKIAGVFLRSDGVPVMFVSTKSLGDANPLDWIHLIPTAVSYTTMSDWDERPAYKEYLQKNSHLLTAETFEAPYAGLGALFKFGDNQSALGGFTAKELTESSAIHGDFDSASLNYSGKQNLEVRQAEDKCKCNRGDWFTSNCWECYECGEHSTKEECWACSHNTTTNGEWKDALCWECTDCGEHYTTAQTFDAHTRHNINRFTTRNNPHTKISNTRRKLKQQMWTDTAATVGIKGLLGIIAVVAIGVIAWKKK